MDDDIFSGLTTQTRHRTISMEEMTSGEDLLLGRALRDPSKVVSYNPDKLTNSHVLLMGKSQSGKTTTLKRFITYMGKPRVVPGLDMPIQKTGIVIDFSGDLDTVDENLIVIKGRKSDFGLNLFELLSKDHDAGGVNVQRANIIRMIERYFLGKMGPVQSSVLEHLITDVYASKGIFEEQEETWELPLPTIKEMMELLLLIVDSVESALSIGMLKRIKSDGKKIRRLDGRIDAMKVKAHGVRKRVEGGDVTAELRLDKVLDQLGGLEEERRALYAGLKELMDEFLEYKIYGEGSKGEMFTEEEGFTIDIGFYSERNALNALKSLRPHIQKIVESGAFSGQLPPIKRGVNRIDLSMLSLPLQKLFTDLFAQKVFVSVRSRGVYREWDRRVPEWRIDTFLAIDEAKLVLPENKTEKDSKEEPINRIVAESLKFGMSILMASQRIGHFSSEQLTNISTKVLFQVGANDAAEARTKLGLKENDLRPLQDFGVGLVMDGTKKSIPTVFPWSDRAR